MGHLPGRIVRIAVLSMGAVEASETRTIVSGASKDNTLFEEAGMDGCEKSNGAGMQLFSGQTRGRFDEQPDARRLLVAFDVAAHVPPGAKIHGVELTLHLSRSRTNHFDFGLHRVLADWGEAASAAGNNEGNGDCAVEGDATWDHRIYPDEPWDHAGGDYAHHASATAAVGGFRSNGHYVWGSTVDMIKDVQHWLDHPDENHGWIVIGPEDDRTAKRFSARESEEPSYQPRLTVRYKVRGNSGAHRPAGD